MAAVHTARHGSVRVNVMRNGGTERYAIRWFPVVGGPERRESFNGAKHGLSAKQRAIERAEEIARGISQGLADVLTLTNSDRDNYRVAVRALEPFGMSLHEAAQMLADAQSFVTPFGREIRGVCREWSEAQKILGNGVSLLEIVREWNQRHLFEQCEYYQFRPPPEPMVAASSTGADIPEAPGIYFVWNGGQIVYVGRSASMHRRCRVGIKHHAVFAGDWVSWLEEPLFRLKFAEAFFIGMLHPTRNFAGPILTSPGQPTSPS